MRPTLTATILTATLLGAACAADAPSAAPEATEGANATAPTASASSESTTSLAATTDPTSRDSFIGADGVTSDISDTSRIVPLSGDLTEIVFELGLGDSVVGVDLTTVFPEEATGLPVIGVGRFLTAEGVLAQQPTLVIGDTQTSPDTAIEQIRSAGVPVVILDIPASFEDLYTNVRILGDVLGAPTEAATLAKRIEGEIADVVSVLGDTEAKRMAYIYTRGPDVVLLFGKGMVSSPLIEAAAGIDAGKESGVEGSIAATAEALVAAAPEVIIVPEEGFGILGGVEQFIQIPGIGQTPAGRTGEIYTYPEGDFLIFGPRVADSLRRLIRDVHSLP